jgi:hypothetical protein
MRSGTCRKLLTKKNIAFSDAREIESSAGSKNVEFNLLQINNKKR